VGKFYHVFQVNDARRALERMGPPIRTFQGLRRAGVALKLEQAAVMAAAWFSVFVLEKLQHREIAYIIWSWSFTRGSGSGGKEQFFIEMATIRSCQATTPRVKLESALRRWPGLLQFLRMYRRMP